VSLLFAGYGRRSVYDKKPERYAEDNLRPVYSDTTQFDVELSCVGEVSIATQLNLTELNSTSS